MGNRKQYSLASAILAAAGDRTVDAGYEIEVNQEAQRQYGRKTGFLIPLDALVDKRAVTAAGYGGSLIGTDHLGDAFIDVMRPRSKVMGLGPTVLSGLRGDVSIPRKLSGAMAYWMDLDGNSSITESDIDLDNVIMSPKSVTGLVIFSHKMMVQSAPGVEGMIRQDLADLIGAAVDAAAIGGSGSGAQPTGLLNQTGVNLVEAGAPDGGPATWNNIVDLESGVADSNGDTGSLAYLTNSKVRGKLKQTILDTGSGKFVWQGEKLNGYKAEVSNNVPSNLTKGAGTNLSAAIFGNWADLIIGQWGVLEIDVDPYGANFAQGNVAVRAIMDIDIGIRQPGSFSIMKDINTA